MTSAYTELFNKLKNKNGNRNVIIVGILPRLKESLTWSSKALAINNWLEQQCSLYNFQFLDLWDIMYQNWYFYNRDGVHLNFKGRAFFTDVILGRIENSRNFLGRM